MSLMEDWRQNGENDSYYGCYGKIEKKIINFLLWLW